MITTSETFRARSSVLAAAGAALALAIEAGSGAARGQSMSFNYTVNANVPDDSSLGIEETQTVSDPNGPLQSVEVSLQLSPIGPDGGWIGDLYAYLRHTDLSGEHTSILLNRIGRTASNSAGLSDGPEINITLAVGEPDIHVLTSPLGSPLTGRFGADGRAIDPNLVLDTSPRTAGLNVFNGMLPGGDWTLFVGDMSGGSQYELDSWGLTLASEPTVPEPAGWMAGTGLVLAGFGYLRRRACPAVS